MKKRINSTGRRKLESEQIDIRINSEEGTKPVSFNANLDFSSTSDLDPKAKVYIEPYVRTSSMRFDFGTVDSVKAPADTRLSELDADGSLLFRVKVVDETGVVGRILAGASGVHARNTDDNGFNRKSLLPLRTTDLGESIWRLSYNSASGPVLDITNKIAGFSSKIQNEPLLRGAIYPQAFREVLRKLIDEPPDSELRWAQDWYAFINALTGHDLLEDEPDDDESEGVIADIVNAFCTAHQFATTAAKYDEVTA